MRKIGGHVSIAGGISNAITNTLNISGNCLQIFAGSPRLWARRPFTDIEASEFNQKITDNNLNPVFIHALYLVNLATDQPDLLKKSIDSLIMDISNGDKINCAGVVVHIGSHQGRGFQSAKKQIVASISEIISKTKTTKFLLENDAGQNGKIGSFEELSEIIAEVNSERLGICVDTAHTFESGIDIRDKKTVEELIANLEKLNILDKITLIHLNDSKTPCGSFRDMHENLGLGEIGLEGLKNFINHEKLSHLPIILEVPGKEKAGPDEKNIAIAKTL